jgi:hypothetical protein
MPSSVVRRFAYDAASKQLRIVFTSGSIYVYEGVPHEVYDGLRSAASRGRYYNAAIRNQFPCRRDGTDDYRRRFGS